MSLIPAGYGFHPWFVPPDPMIKVMERLEKIPCKVNCKLVSNLRTSAEARHRLEELRFAFGSNSSDHFCEQVKAYMDSLRDQERECRNNNYERRRGASTVLYLNKIVRQESLSAATLHLAVHLLNRYLDKNFPSCGEYWVVVLTCLVIAGKVEEKKRNVPYMTKLRKYMPPGMYVSYTETEFLDLYTATEVEILKFFNWKVMIPTAWTFLEFYLLFAVDEEEYKHRVIHPIHENDTWGPPNVSCLPCLAYEIVNLLLLGRPMATFLPSLVAAGVLMLSRFKLGFMTWPKRLEFVTGYPYDQVYGCVVDYILPEDKAMSELASREDLDFGFQARGVFKFG